MALITTARCATCALEIVQGVFNARFELLGINAVMLGSEKASRLRTKAFVDYFRQNDLLDDASWSIRSSRFASFFIISAAIGDACGSENHSGCSVRILCSLARKKFGISKLLLGSRVIPT
jgi:hypothetical protein